MNVKVLLHAVGPSSRRLTPRCQISPHLAVMEEGNWMVPLLFLNLSIRFDIWYLFTHGSHVLPAELRKVSSVSH